MAKKIISDLPILLQRYVRGEASFPNNITYSKEQVLLTRQLRKQYLRDIQGTSPGLQYDEPDYFDLMGNEIRRYGKTKLEPLVLATWTDALLECPRLRNIYENTPLPRANERQRLSYQKQNRLELERRRAALRTAITDPRTLGEIELYCTGRVFYGMPHWQT